MDAALSCDWLIRRQPELRLKPLVLIVKEHGGLAVSGCNLAALAAGVRVGIKLADARALEPMLIALDADPERDRRALDALAEWCERFTPLTAIDLPGEGSPREGSPRGLFLDIAGCAHLFGGEEAMIDRVIAGLNRIGYEAYAAIADTPGAAWAISRYAANAKRPGIVIDAGRQEHAIASLPVAALRITLETETVLQRLGLRRIGELYDIPRAALGKRFGKELLLRYDQALGAVSEPISPRRPPARYAAKECLAEPISTSPVIELVTQRLLETLCCDLTRDGQGVRLAELSWWRVDGEIGRLRIGTSAPSQAPKHLFRLLAEHLDTISPGFGIEAMALTAIRTDPIRLTQTGIEAEHKTVDLAALVDRLANRFGSHNIRRLAPQESWLPELATRPIPAFARIRARPWPSDRPRPLQLLSRPEPIEVIAPLPDDPPVLLRWKGNQRRIVKAEGPERIEAEWWKRNELPRDYYRVEDESGRRYWVYRAGLYQGGATPQWFLHGLFA